MYYEYFPWLFGFRLRFYVLWFYPSRKLDVLIPKDFKSLAEFFNPLQLLPADVVAELEDEALDLIWSMHRVGDEPNLGDYNCALSYLYDQKYRQYFELTQ